MQTNFLPFIQIYLPESNRWSEFSAGISFFAFNLPYYPFFFINIFMADWLLCAIDRFSVKMSSLRHLWPRAAFAFRLLVIIFLVICSNIHLCHLLILKQHFFEVFSGLAILLVSFSDRKIAYVYFHFLSFLLYVCGFNLSRFNLAVDEFDWVQIYSFTSALIIS